jgi:hypothetical protein
MLEKSHFYLPAMDLQWTKDRSCRKPSINGETELRKMNKQVYNLQRLVIVYNVNFITFRLRMTQTEQTTDREYVHKCWIFLQFKGLCEN